MTNLTPEQKSLFDALHDDKVQDYKVFSKRDYGRLFSSLIDKYPESAHFVYELLQNAEDANATRVSIVLKKDRLIFKHNGTKHFDVTPLDSDKVGDINSITGFGFSSKVTDLKNEQEISTQKIGKFGVGFKSVFQYTDTPEIYDDIYCFKIENYIIPTLIDHDDPARQQGETLFIFRFKDQNRKQAYDHIKRRLQNLKNPLLFLRNIKKIVWRIDSSDEPNTEYTYEKQLTETSQYDDITLERYSIIEPKETSSIFLFSKNIKIEDKGIFPIYVGYYYDEQKKQLITDTKRNIYCFFPTKVSFNTCFIAHAPFLLTDNRQDLKPDTEINESLVDMLATLSAETVVLLRDYGIKHNNLLINENITDICPQYEYDSDNYDNIYEEPFKEAFKDIINDEPLLLSRNDKYLLPSKAYHTHIGVFELVDQKQLEILRTQSHRDYYEDNADGVDFLQWKLAQNIQRIDDDCEYFEEVSRYDIADFGRDITADFMNAMDFDWVIKFYNFLREHASAHINITNQTKGNELVFRRAPIIYTQKKQWVAPFINKTTPNVYLPVVGGEDKTAEYNFINDKYLSNEYAMKLFTQLELKTPDKYDYIRNIVLSKYAKNDVDIDDEVIRNDFLVLLNYYQEIQNTTKEDDFIKLVRDSLFLVGTNESHSRPSELILETPLLKQYFNGDQDIVFFDLYFYRKQIHNFKTSFIIDFVKLLGVQTEPQVLTETFYSLWKLPNHIRKEVEKIKCYEFHSVEDPQLQGFDNACQKKNITKDISVYLWNDIICKYTDIKDAKILTRQKHKQYHNINHCQSTFLHLLLTEAWIFSKDGKICSPQNLHIEDLAPEYNLFNGVTDLLGIVKATPDMQEKYGVTAEEQKQFELGAKLKALLGDDLSEDELMQMIEERKRQKREAKAPQKATPEQPQVEQPTTPQSSAPHPTTPEQPKESIEEKLKRKLEEKKNRFVGKPHSKTDKGTEIPFDNPTQEILSPQNNAPFFVETNNPINEAPQDPDETARAEKNLKAKNTKAQEQAETAGEQVEYLDLLNQTPKYTFKWFQILMMLMHAGQDKITERRVQIDFSKYELIASNKILQLTEPTLPVPAWVSDAEKYSITAIADGNSAKIDGLIVKTEDDCLDISIEVNDRILAELKRAKKIRIIAIDNTNIIDSLETRFLQLEKEDDFDMNANLPDNLSFIYGPPGTGKTTELVKQVHDLLEQEPSAKILVLTPTNKAADVVAIKMANDDVCESGLARYGATESLYLIEDIGCLTNRDTTDMSWHNVVVATAARYAYDYLQPDDTPICDYPWDYIFIDEASMIDILTITYIIYKGAAAKKIIISGDPMQIRPVVQNDMPDLNIYDMVNLHGFSEAIYDYDRFEVKGLTMQHRSIPVIGKLVSKFAYDGLVDCDPNRAPMKPLTLDGLNIRNVNFVGFDVAELDDIKGLNAVNNSAFNLYSVIFTYNMIDYTIKQIEKHYPEKEYTIGVVCAYRAQSDAIKNMLENRPLDTMYCKVTCGTVHSFQGDECDIMFIVLNPPAICTKGAHVNNENIINVAMSRARDYIFFVLPNGQQKGFSMKNRIGKNIVFTDRAIIKCSDVERLMFQGNENFIYENTHVTCHMPVNVYCEDNALYEVRMSDDALDIKINPMHR